ASGPSTPAGTPAESALYVCCVWHPPCTSIREVANESLEMMRRESQTIFAKSAQSAITRAVSPTAPTNSNSTANPLPTSQDPLSAAYSRQRVCGALSSLFGYAPFCLWFLLL